MSATPPASPLDDYRGRAVLITGGLGFIGANLARALLAGGCARVIVVDSLDPGAGGDPRNLAGLSAPLEVHQASIADRALVASLIAGVDVVFNLAGRSDHLASAHDPLGDLDANCSAQLAFLEACRARRGRLRIVFTSTRQVYGTPRSLPVDETHPLDPPDVNAVHKLAAEHYHRLHARATGAEVVCLRLTNVYGPRQSLAAATLGFFPTFLKRALDGGCIELFDGGAMRRDLLYVDDAVDALLRAGVHPAAAGGLFNVGTPHPVPLREVAERLIALTGRGTTRSVPFPAERRALDIGDYATDPTRLTTLLAWHPTVPLAAGLSRTLQYYLEEGT